LLECIVFGARAGNAAAEYAQTISREQYASIRIQSDDVSEPAQEFDVKSAQETIRQRMWESVGILRHGTSLKAAADTWAEFEQNRPWNRIEAFEFQNMLDVAKVITEAAITRTESRGAHYREDYPERDDTNWRRHIVICRDKPTIRIE
jgi:succinate dehydrogenase/fumarate reductase flavoprotein subunit